MKKTKGAKYIVEYLESKIQEFQQGAEFHGDQMNNFDKLEGVRAYHQQTRIQFLNVINELQSMVLNLKLENKIK